MDIGAIGIDEVGRGCWAGPLLVVAAKADTDLPLGLSDSKKLTRLSRERLFEQLLFACQFGEGWVTPAEIDKLGLSSAMRVGVKRALEALGASVHLPVIIDGNINYCPADYAQVSCVVGGDALHPIVSAASIIAKVTRDRYMAELSARYPAYGFAEHVGYGTAHHLAMLKQHGVSDVHRRSYKPVKALA